MRILMLTSWSDMSTPPELSTASVLTQAAAAPQYSSRPRCVKPRLPPSAITRARTSLPVDAHAVVGAVADFFVFFRRRLHVGADAAVVEQVDAARSGCGGSPPRRWRALRLRCRAACASPARAGWTWRSGRRCPPPLLMRLAVVVAPGRARQVEEALALAKVDRGSGSGSMKMCAWLKAATSRVALLSSMPLPKTSPAMSPMPATVKGCFWTSRPRLRKWCFTHSQAPRAVMPTFLWS